MGCVAIIKMMQFPVKLQDDKSSASDLILKAA